MNCFLTITLTSIFVGVKAENSILDIINTDYVDKLLAAKRLNESKVVENAWNKQSKHEVRTNDINQDNLPDVYENTVITQNRIVKNKLPDFSSILSDLARSDKLLKAEPTSLLVTKKEYLKKDWCRTEPILQRVREEGCIPKNVINRFCYGQCNSFFIPKNLSPRKGKKKKMEKKDDSPSFRSCGVCKPKKTAWVQVTLQCPGLNPPLRRRKVLKIKHCQCLAENVN